MENKQLNNKVFLILYFLILPFSIHALVFPDSFISFRDTVYLQNRELLETMRLYAQAKQDIQNALTNADMYLALSRCEYLMGITFISLLIK